jgi:hypothetical protein
MAGDKGRVATDRKAGLGLQHAQGGDRNCHQRGLGIFGKLQGFCRAFPDHRRELFAERRVDLVSSRSCLPMSSLGSNARSSTILTAHAVGKDAGRHFRKTDERLAE